MRLIFIPIHVFRETPAVTFFDASVEGSNGTDVVAHHGAAISPPDDLNGEQYYVHQHQIDHNLVLEGGRIYTLLNPQWDQPHHVIHLIRAMGALQIPMGTFHRSVSAESGSVVLNQSIRDQAFDFATEFIPVSLHGNRALQAARAQMPWVWTFRDGHICRSLGLEGGEGASCLPLSA